VKVGPAQEPNQPFGGASHWFLSKKSVPLSRKNTLVVGKGTTAEEVAQARKAGMRVIGEKPFWKAHAKLAPEVFKLDSTKRELQNMKSLKEQLKGSK
jgi:hypothetical protein